VVPSAGQSDAQTSQSTPRSLRVSTPTFQKEEKKISPMGAAQRRSATLPRLDRPSPPQADDLQTRGTPEFLVVALVLAAHGIRGEIKCRIVTDFPTRRFKRGNTVLIRGEPHTIQGARIQGGTVLLRLEDIQDRDIAAALRGAEIEVPTEQAVSLPKGQFYWHQVIGLRVEDATSHEPLGEVTDIIETGANDVYIVRGPKGEILVPAIKDVVKNIDPTEGRMLIQPLPGMLPR
jgi:16S rRNA processing protein RimM